MDDSIKDAVSALRSIFDATIKSVLLSGGDGWGWIVCNQTAFVSTLFELYLNEQQQYWVKYEFGNGYHYVLGEQDGVSIVDKLSKGKSKTNDEIVVRLGHVFDLIK